MKSTNGNDSGTHEPPTTTAASTVELPAVVRRCMPPTYADLTLAIFADRERLKSAPARGRQTRTERIEEAIERAIRDYRVELEMEPLPRRTEALRKKLKVVWRRYDLLTQCPSLKVIRRVARRFWSL